MNRRDFLAAAPALLEQRGAPLPLELPFTDSAGRSLRLRDMFDGSRPVLLVPGYWTCPELCGLLMQSLLQGLQQAQADRAAFRIVGFSVDPHDTSASARAREDSDRGFAAMLSGEQGAAAGLDLRLLVGAAGGRLADAIGVRHARAGTGYEHAAVVAVATPDGRVSRYLPGVAFAPDDLRIALARARGGRIGGWSERLTLLCSHLAPQSGRYNDTVLNATRVTGLGAAALLGAWCWRRRQGGRDER